MSHALATVLHRGRKAATRVTSCRRAWHLTGSTLKTDRASACLASSRSSTSPGHKHGHGLGHGRGHGLGRGRGNMGAREVRHARDEALPLR